MRIVIEDVSPNDLLALIGTKSQESVGTQPNEAGIKLVQQFLQEQHKAPNQPVPRR